MASFEAISISFLGLVPFWFALLTGLLIGWLWRPRWAAALVFLALNPRSRFVWTVPPGLGASRIWLALTAISLFSTLNRFFPRLKFKASPKATSATLSDSDLIVTTASHQSDSSFSGAEGEQPSVTDADLETLLSCENEVDGGPPWLLIMEKSTSTLAFRAWRRDPKIGPTQYRTKTVIEDIAPDLLRDFFWDDEFRTTWDNMLIYFKTLQECPHTGTMVVHWIRKFPFFCSDREYIIVRRIWELGSTYYCVTKNTVHPAVARRRKPRRVDLYFSSWRIKAVEGRNGGQQTASEVLLFHHEEMGIPKEIAKIAIQRGMWGLVRRMDAGVQAYHLARVNGAPLSVYAVKARIATKRLSSNSLLPEPESSSVDLRIQEVSSSSLLPEPESSSVDLRIQEVKTSPKLKLTKHVLKWLIVGGVLVALGINRGAIEKGIAFGIVKCFGRDQKHKKNRREGG